MCASISRQGISQSPQQPRLLYLPQRLLQRLLQRLPRPPLQRRLSLPRPPLQRRSSRLLHYRYPVKPTATPASGYTGWKTVNGKDYWYENGVKQGTTGRGKEIYDPDSDAWYWLDANQGGAKAVSKDVYQESNGGKWVRYDANGHMIKGWDTNDDGTYYFDLVTGAMTKGDATIDGLPCSFDTVTGIGCNCGCGTA